MPTSRMKGQPISLPLLLRTSRRLLLIIIIFPHPCSCNTTTEDLVRLMDPSGGICASGNEHTSGLLNISIKMFLKSRSRWRNGCNYSLCQSLLPHMYCVCVRHGLNLVREVHFHEGVFVNGMCSNSKNKKVMCTPSFNL